MVKILRVMVILLYQRIVIGQTVTGIQGGTSKTMHTIPLCQDSANYTSGYS